MAKNSDSIRAATNIYTALVKSDEPLCSDSVKENMNILIDMFKNNLSSSDIEVILSRKIREDRGNKTSYLTRRDRSSVNREAYLGQLRLKLIITVFMFMSIGFIGLISILFFYVDLHSYLIREGIALYDYKTIIEDWLKPFHTNDSK